MFGVSQIQGALCARTWCSNSHTNHSIIEPRHFFFWVSGPGIWQFFLNWIFTVPFDYIGRRCSSFQHGRVGLIAGKDVEALFCYMLKIWMFFRLTRTTSLSYRSKQNRGSMNKLWWSLFQFRQSDKHLQRIDMSPSFFCTCNMGYLQLLDWFHRLFVE